MAKFGFGDLITLAKSGWTPEEVNKTIDRLEALPGDSTDETKRAGDSEEDSSDESVDDNTSNDTKGADDSEDKKDARIKELENQLAEAQKHNQRQNNDSGEKKNLDDLVDDIFKEYFD